MARKKTVCRGASGLYVRNLGWEKTANGYVQHKFYLGRNEQEASLASLRLERLWVQVSKRWERESQSELYPTDRPIWNCVTIAIAEAVRKGAAVAQVPLPVPFSAMVPESPMIADWLNRLQDDITVVKIEILDECVNAHAETNLQNEGHRLIDMGRRILHKRGGATLHAALNAYSKSIENTYLTTEKRITAWGGVQIRQAAFLRNHLPDCHLANLNTQQIEQLLDALRMRPRKSDHTPVSVSWTRNCIKQFRHFIRWLNKSPEFDWRRPHDLEQTQMRIPLTSEEKSARIRTAQVQTYSVDELRFLWEYATPFQRLIMLLGLNCGFNRAEIASLELSDVILHRQHPHWYEVGVPEGADESWILRIRQKTDVYGEWKLWHETVAALEWWLRQRSRIEVAPDVQTLLVTRWGRRYDEPTKGNNANCQIPNAWRSLWDRIRHDHPKFRRLSFGKIRKTAGNLIRMAADGETSGIFLCHGTPVKSDQLLDVYTNRPFIKVFRAIEKVGERLRPLWAGVSCPFPDATQKGGSNISLALIRRIQTMRSQGFKITVIAEKTGVSRETVRRWIARPNDSCKCADMAKAK